MKRLLLGILLVLFVVSNAQAQGVFTPLPTTSQSSGTGKVSPTCGNGAKGAWTQLTAATTANVTQVVIDINTVQAQEWYFDIGTGAGGSESVKVGDLFVSVNTAVGNESGHWTVSLFILSGIRVAVRCREDSGTDTPGVHITMMQP